MLLFSFGSDIAISGGEADISVAHIRGGSLGTDFKSKLGMDILVKLLLLGNLACSSGTVMSYFWLFIGITFNMNNV